MKDYLKKYECDGQMSIFDFIPKDEPLPLPGFRGGKVPASVESCIAQIARLEANESVSREYIDKTREDYGIPKNGEIIYFESGLTVYQAKVIECVEDKSDTYIRVSAGGHEWQIRSKWFMTKEDAEKEVAKTWQGKIKYQPLPKSERPKKSGRSQTGKDTDVPGSVTDKNVGDKHWHRFPKETPPEGVRLEVMYQWTYVQKADRLGVCMADWTGKDFFWHGKPWDIGKVIPIAWRIGVDGYTPINDRPVVFNGKFNSKCSTCNGWHFNSHRESSCPFDDCNEGNGYKDYESLFVNTEKENVHMKGVCKDSGHECNSQELWKVAKEIGTECREVCCRKCDVRGCGARCNGSSEPPKVRLWHRLCKMKPEKSGYYEIMDIDGKKGKAWYEAIRGDFDHVTGRQIECWREN